MRDVMARLDEVAQAVPADRWVLIGGLMVHAHASLARVEHARPTDDVDLVVEIQAGHYAESARVLESIGYQRHEPLDASSPFHRFNRDGEHLDLMAPEGQQVRYSGRPVLNVPGSRSALKRTIPWALPTRQEIRIPDLASALSLKGAALQQPSPNRIRHAQDGVTLFACAQHGELTLSKSMRANVNQLLVGLTNPDSWAFSAPMTRRSAIRAILQFRPDWNIPEGLITRRA